MYNQPVHIFWLVVLTQFMTLNIPAACGGQLVAERIKSMSDAEIINLQVNEEHNIDLVGMGNVGYSWVYDMDNENVVTISHQYIVPPNPKPGDRGIERFTLRGIQSGSCIIEFRQIQSWEKDQPPFSVRKFQVHVK